jgi:hypothetical protein
MTRIFVREREGREEGMGEKACVKRYFSHHTLDSIVSYVSCIQIQSLFEMEEI